MSRNKDRVPRIQSILVTLNNHVREMKIMNTKQKLNQSASTVMRQCMALQPHEQLLIVSNIETTEIAQALFSAGESIAPDTRWIVYPTGNINGEEPPSWVAEALKCADVVVAPTQKSISHTRARREACEKYKTRIATLPGITTDSFIRGLSADYDAIAKISERVYQALASHKIANITSSSGTRLTIELGNKPIQSIGQINTPGAFSNLPDGESELAPTNANGTLVVDCCGQLITEPTRITINDGNITDIEKTASGQRFETLIRSSEKQDGNANARFIAEFAIGTNPNAKLSGNLLEDEKVLGTCHIAFGDNTSYPGGINESVLHIDTIVKSPTIYLDDLLIMEEGRLLI
ncbi:MAG: aminopeptidase (leucyl aminopeptidase, aminopeptidase T) [Candidatus Magnetoglobus multicellularis str. Araruama]|uniref:Aminopeptidase (Leucyl aminopeptidase, aminopeptidase T) n=1 Tax=Candidatus Magnetoglobus multicellularis str. Araruama TaxID=890399 RepID=A0A1V1P5S4_9BACT|nr:MAG: aminopeptidase (leucyl aminopeptidase, aminopeptidase T) [Candidatus Magnetoglobus multicellularis str. Araruama]